MTSLSNRLDQALNKAIIKAPIIPVKTEQGILVGNVLIQSVGNLKNLWQYNQLMFEGINLNAAAIKLANNLAKYGQIKTNFEIYSADQDYGRWLYDSQVFYANFIKAKNKSQYERADTLWARYCESRDRCYKLKTKVEQLSSLGISK